MDVKRWERIQALYHAAMEREPSERPAFVESACDGDPELRREVESLLDYAGQGDELLEAPVWNSADPETFLAPGTRIGVYEIVDLLGRGGMGEVYKAEDTRLKRTVAIKVLSRVAGVSPDEKVRFLQEARAVSALNHPHIVQIYELESHQGEDFIVMEFLDGQTLATILRARRLTLDESLDYSAQIASALVAAHSAGIVHRDIKPGNIIVNDTGVLKLLDFGLAKLVRRAAAGETTVTAPETASGSIVGTASYMSPEQAEGKPIDARSDIFSFGAVLYEMLTGRRAFPGESVVAILAGVLKGEPKPIGECVSGLPAEVDRAVTRCLRKDPSRRFQNMSDLKVVLQELQDESGSGRLSVEAPARAKGRKWLWPAIGAVCLLAAAGALWLRGRQTAVPPRLIPLTSFPGVEQQPSLSPDGTQVAFSWDGEKEDNLDIYVKQIDGEGFTRLTTGPVPEHTPRWSPDGRLVAFVRGGREGGVMLIPAIGGPARKVSGDRNLQGWTPDSKSLLVGRSDGTHALLFILSIEGGQARQLTVPPNAFYGDTLPAVSPDGRTLAFFRSPTPSTPDLHLVPMAGGEPRRVTQGLTAAGGLTWTADGKEIVFSADRGGGVRLWRVPAGASPEQAPVLVESAGEDAEQPQIAGTRLVYARRHQRVNLWRTALDGRADSTRILASTRRESAPAYSPDGRRIAFISNRTGADELWMSDAEGANPVRLTNHGVIGAPAWSPDSKWLLFLMRAGAVVDLHVIGPDGGAPRRITQGLAGYYPSYSRDGKWIYFMTAPLPLHIEKIPSEGGQPVTVAREAFQALESADGRYLLYTKLATVGGTRPSSFWKMPIAGGEEVQIHDAVYAERWQPFGDGVYFQDFRSEEKTVYFLDIETKVVKKIASIANAQGAVPGFAVSPDGRWIITAHSEPPTSDIMLVDNFR